MQQMNITAITNGIIAAPKLNGNYHTSINGNKIDKTESFWSLFNKVTN